MFLATGAFGIAGRTRYQFCGAVHDLPANQVTQSQTLSFGPIPGPGETRHLIIGLDFVTASGVKPSSVTAGGQAATEVVAHAPPGLNTIGQGIYIVEAPAALGTSGTVAFSVSTGDIDGGAIFVWAAYNLKSTTADDTETEVATGAGASDLSINVLDHGAVFAVAGASNVNSTTFSWAGLTADSSDGDPSDHQSGASALDVSAASPRTVTVSIIILGNPFTVNSVAASFH